MPPRAQLARQALKRAGILRQAPRQRDQRFPFAGRARALAGAFQQLDAELLLQRLDLRGQRRLGDAEAGGGAAEMPFLGDGEEMAEAADETEIHGAPRSRFVLGRGLPEPCEAAFSRGAIRNPYRPACPIGMDDQTAPAQKANVSFSHGRD